MLKYIKVLLLVLTVIVSACSKEDKKEQTQASNLLISATQTGEIRQAYKVDVADTKEKMYHGLMGRTFLEENSGFLFDVNLVPHDMEVAMWMKDTLIELDMLFADENGNIFYIYEHAQPNDTTPIYPPHRPRVVLEINGGQAAQYGIKVGDVIKTPTLGNLE